MIFRCSVAEMIRECDERIRLSRETSEPFSSVELEQYRNLVAHAEVEVLKTCQIVLCTCNASASPKMRHGTHIGQVRARWYCVCVIPALRLRSSTALE